MFCRIAEACGVSLGASAITVASTFTTRAFFFRQQIADPLQNFHAADASNRFVGIWKMLSDVAGTNRAEQRVGDRVRENVGI
jgi:hypothetical protein